MLSSAHRVIALVNAPNPFSRPFLEQVRLAGVATGATGDPLMLHNIGELEAAFATIEKRRPDAVTLQPTLGLGRVAELAVKYREPTVCPLRSFVDDGGLMS
jgi:putative ABC transport system substrate-binding protein